MKSFGTYRSGDDRRKDRRTKDITDAIKHIPINHTAEWELRKIKALEIANLIAIANCPLFSDNQRKDAANIVAEQTFGG